jgi:ABC-type maltose transport system permease subunit
MARGPPPPDSRVAAEARGVATLAGYALSRFRTPVINAYASGLFLVQMFPILLALIPLSKAMVAAAIRLPQSDVRRDR